MAGPPFLPQACLRFLASADDIDPDTLTDAAVAAEAQATGLLDASNSALVEARAALEAARAKHAELEAAASQALILAAPRPIDDYPAVDRALGHARQVGGGMAGGGRHGRGQAGRSQVVTVTEIPTLTKP